MKKDCHLCDYVILSGGQATNAGLLCHQRRGWRRRSTGSGTCDPEDSRPNHERDAGTGHQGVWEKL